MLFVMLELGQNEENFHKTPINKPIPNLKRSIYILIRQIVNEPRNHHEMASPLKTRFSCTKHAQDKHDAKKKSLSDIHFSQKYCPNWVTELTLGNLEIKEIVM